MEAFHIALVLATLLCTLVAGFVFAFAAVVMPGIRKLDDGEFLRAFQVIDGVIQRGQPAFMVVWVGSALALIASAALGFGQTVGVDRFLLIAAVLVYLLGVQLPTAVINIPLNNRVQALTIASMDETARNAARLEFESRWNRSNVTRTILASLVSVLLLVLLLRL